MPPLQPIRHGFVAANVGGVLHPVSTQFVMGKAPTGGDGAIDASFLHGEGFDSVGSVTTITFSSVPFGAAAADRKLIIAMNAAGGIDTSTTLTAGGVSASVFYRPGDSIAQPEFWYAEVPTGTSGDIVVTKPSSNTDWAITVWRVSNWAGTAAHATAKNGTGAETNPSLSIAVPEQGFVMASVRTSDETSSFAWSGATERYEESIGTFLVGGADAGLLSAQTLGISMTVAAVSRLSAVSIGPE